MTISMYQASVEVFVPYLENLSGFLDHAAASAQARKIEPAVLLGLRIAPDMFNLMRQVCEVNRHATLACALLADVTPPAILETEADIPELQARIHQTIAFLQGLPREVIDASADREISFTFRNGRARVFTGRSLLLTFSAPQFFFHIATAYDILRQAGVELIKKDFLGPPRPVEG